jgi:lipopolysaccharide transport system permease protein
MQPEQTEPIAVYRPNQRHELGFWRTWGVMLRNTGGARDLIWQLFKRDFLGAYKKSFLGIAWVFIAPVLGIVSWVFLQQTGVLRPGQTGVPYPVYVLVGSSMWGLFMGFFSSAARTLLAGQDFILQVHYPHEVLLFQQVGQHLAQFVVALAVNLAVLAAFGVVPSWRAVLLPLVVLPLFLLGAGLGLLFSMFSVVAVDLRRGADMALGLAMYLTPVVYGRDVPSKLLQEVVRWNPLTYLVCSARDILLQGRLYDARGYAAASVLAVAVFAVSWRLFFLSEDKIVERMI